jgi:hypothetical protein
MTSLKRASAVRSGLTSHSGSGSATSASLQKQDAEALRDPWEIYICMISDKDIGIEDYRIQGEITRLLDNDMLF